jgi:hypothetical protein
MCHAQLVMFPTCVQITDKNIKVIDDMVEKKQKDLTTV